VEDPDSSKNAFILFNVATAAPAAIFLFITIIVSDPQQSDKTASEVACQQLQTK